MTRGAFLWTLLLGLLCVNCGRSNAQETHTATALEVEAEELMKTVIPTGTPEKLRDYTGYTLSFNPKNKTPNWVAWHLTAEETDGASVRKDADFWQDSKLSGCPTKQDYSHSGFDRGHMCPAADMKWSPEAMNDCFSMANICPQDGALNRGAWQTLEKKEREWAQRDGSLVIVAGPIYERGDTQRIGSAGVRVPSAFFKVLLAPDVDQPRAIAFIYPNMTAPGNMKNYAMSVDELEEATGYDFFSALPDDIEAKVEASFSWKEWIRK